MEKRSPKCRIDIFVDNGVMAQSVPNNDLTLAIKKISKALKKNERVNLNSRYVTQDYDFIIFFLSIVIWMQKNLNNE